ncbi:MAG TPA: cysteine desulfurase [Candidatus Dormibacteraeota bacterium]|jgi:cysteine desulfurase/selenocysteine lyase|nr:cysteine desulfurase [Candidatus Dormibacteraeota bacterium]
MLRSESSTLDVQSIRRDFPIFETGAAYLDSANTAQRPRQVVEAMVEYFEQYNANILRAAYAFSERATEHFEGAREKVRRFINAASTKEVIFTSGTTGGINLVAYSWGRRNIEQGDLLVTTVMEHHSNLVPWQILAEEKGAELAFVDIDEQGRLRQDQFQELLTRGPKLVAFNQISNTLGTINPYREMTRAAKEAGAIVLIDGAQGAPHLGFDVRETGCDFYAFSSHKMCGPTGIGVLYGRRELLREMPPFLAGGEMINVVSLERSTYADLPHKFEAGTQPIAEAIGLGAAIDYLESVGMEAIKRHDAELTEYAHESLSEVPGLRVFGPPPGPDRTGVLSFDVDGIHPHDIATILDRHDVYCRSGHNCTMPLMTRLDVAATVRASVYLYNTREEIDRLVAGLHDARRIFGVER